MDKAVVARDPLPAEETLIAGCWRPSDSGIEDHDSSSDDDDLAEDMPTSRLDGDLCGTGRSEAVVIDV